MNCTTKPSWADASLEDVTATLESIDDARGLYLVEHFPDAVHKLVARDFRRFYAGKDPEEWILLDDGTEPEAVNAVLGLVVAERIAKERGAEYESAVGAQRTLRRIKAAVLGLEADV